MMAPNGRFGGGPPSLHPYQQPPFSNHPSQSHTTNHPPPSLTNSAYLNSQISPFAANGLGLGGGINTPAGFGVGDQTGFASHAARSGFQHAAQLQQQHHQQQQQQQPPQPQHSHQQSHGLAPDRSARPIAAAKARIREVWRHNFQEEMEFLMDLVDQYPYVAMDTEFPGIVGRPMGNFRGKSDYHYQCLRVNVDLLKVIQIGISLFNEKGETPSERRQGGQTPLPLAWQFNFRFSLKDDMYNQASIDSLQQAGIDFNLLERDGIDPQKFAALFIASGFVCFDHVKWLSFHGGYDFGYLTKLLTDTKLANDDGEFDKIMKKWFPTTYDVKHLMKYCVKLHNSGLLTPSDPAIAEIMAKFEQKSGLESIADALKIKRAGTAHQAGSDSLLTGKVFFQLRERIYNGEIPDDHIGKIWGLGFSGLEMPLTSHQQQNTDNTPPSNTNGNTNGNPSTPSTVSVGLASTPAAHSHNTNGIGMGPMTPGGGGGVFGSFNFPPNPTR